MSGLSEVHACAFAPDFYCFTVCCEEVVPYIIRITYFVVCWKRTVKNVWYTTQFHNQIYVKTGHYWFTDDVELLCHPQKVHYHRGRWHAFENDEVGCKSWVIIAEYISGDYGWLITRKCTPFCAVPEACFLNQFQKECNIMLIFNAQLSWNWRLELLMFHIILSNGYFHLLPPQLSDDETNM